MPADKAARLREVAKVYGSPSASQFVRDMVTAIVSGDGPELRTFLVTLSERLTRQMVLDIQESAPILPPRTANLVKRKVNVIRGGEGGRRAKRP